MGHPFRVHSLLCAPVVLAVLAACGGPASKTLTPFERNGLHGYTDARGHVVLEPVYLSAQPFNAEGIAAVVTPDSNWSIIDSRGRVLLHPLLFDNGPDDFSEGLARFEEAGKIGYFDTSGRIVIPARFAWAEPFAAGRARFCEGCTRRSDGEHSSMAGGTWGEIDRTGKTVLAPRVEPAASSR